MVNHGFSNLYPMDMGERIKYAREQAGLSAAELARRVNVSKGAVTQWEQGQTKNLRMENLFSLEDVTGFNARWLALEEGPRKVSDSEVVALTPEEFDNRLAALSPEEVAALLRLAADQISGK